MNANIYQRILLVLSSVIICLSCQSQALSYIDPAQGYLKLMLDKNTENSYQQIGNFKVIGSSYLFGERLKGSAYGTNEKSENIELSYNMYKQELDVYPTASSYAILKPAGQLDSFFLFKSESQFLKEDLRFYSSKLFKSSMKDCFLLRVFNGKKYSLYKSYNATLDYVSTNYVQSDLRQFSVEYNYYYCDNETKQLKKIKLTKKKVAEEFSELLDATPYLNDQNFNLNPELSFRLIFSNIPGNQ